MYVKYLIFLFRNFSFLRKKYLFQKDSILFLSYYAHLDSSGKHTAWGDLYQKYALDNNFLYFFLPSKKNFFFKNKNHFFTNNFLSYWKPCLAIFIDSEIWPCRFKNLNKKKIPLILLNARITNNSFQNWSKLKNFAESIFNKITQL